VYERLAGRLRVTTARVFASLNLWDICALIAGSRVYCGGSLHGRIVAMAYALPRINISHPDHLALSRKHVAYAATWEAAGLAGTVPLDGLANAVDRAMAADRETLRNTALELARQYRTEFAALARK